MASEQQREKDIQGQERVRLEGGVGSPVCNEAYNVIACLHEKLQGLEAMRKFAKDADDAEVWKSVGQLDLEAVDVLLGELEKIVQNGKLRSAISSMGKRPAARS